MSDETNRLIGFRGVVGLSAVIGVVLVGLPLVLEVDHLAHWLRIVIEVGEKLGDALLIAAILAVFVENAPEHVSRILIEMFGRALPQELIDHIQTYFKWDFVRTDWNITYVITHVAGSPGDMTLLATSSYFMENGARKPMNYKFVYSVEVGSNPRTVTVIRAVTTKNRAWSPSEIANSTYVSADGYLTVENKSIPLDPREKYRFGAESIQGFRDEKVSPHWALYPVVGATFTIYHPDDFTVEFDATFEDEPIQPAELKDRAAEQLIGKRYTITTPILPGQGFLVRCAKQRKVFGAPSGQPAIPAGQD